MKTLLTSVLFLFLTTQLIGQDKLYPVIQGYGAVEIVDFKVDLPIPTDQYKLISEMYTRQDNKEELYGMLDYSARILNAHVAAGVPKENIKLAVVIFSGATPTILKNEEYKKRFGVENPNKELLDKMIEAGVAVIVCGQSMVKQNIKPEQVHEGVQQAFSRITATSSLINAGYSIF